MRQHAEIPRPPFSTGCGIALLAPGSGEVPETFAAPCVDASEHSRLMAEMQRLRGSIYREDGAIPSKHLTHDGRHVQAIDASSWHVLVLDGDGSVQGCARYRDCGSAPRFRDMAAGGSALAASRQWGPRLRSAVEDAVRSAEQRGLAWVEVGGWALSAELRCTTRALGIAFGTWALGQALGGCLGITTATRRHCSASILRRVGGRPFVWHGQELPAYYDPSYDCEMEILHFDSSAPNERFLDWIEQWAEYLRSVPVLCARESQPVFRRQGRGAGESLEVRAAAA